MPVENIFIQSISMKEWHLKGLSNLQPPNYQSDMHLTEYLFE